MKNMSKSLVKSLSAVVFLCLLLAALSAAKPVKAAGSQVSIGEIDYEELTMKIYKNGNSIVYFSTDNKKTWNEVEGVTGVDAKGAYFLTDISWTSASAETKVFFKGNSETTVINIVFPKQSTSFKAKFDAVNTNFEFSGEESATSFYWRKSTDYNWTSVSFDEGSASYKQFLSQIQVLRFKGAKIVIRTGQVKGTDENNVGERPSREFTVAISKLPTAPSIKVNTTKLTLNTKNTLEYMDGSGNWITCEANMAIEDIAPAALYSNGGNSVRLQIRTAATEKKAASLITTVVIPGQTRGPIVGSLKGGSEIKAGVENKKYVLIFSKASSTKVYEYCIVKPDADFDAQKASWKAVKNTKPIKLSLTAVPEGSTIYFRYKGIAENTSKNIALQLPSEVTEFSAY